MAIGLLGLPPETLDNIGRHLRSRKTWAAFRLTCRQIEAGARNAWANKYFSEANLALTSETLSRLAQLGKLDVIASAVKSITVLCEDDDDDPWGAISSTDPGGAIPSTDPEPLDNEDLENPTNERLRTLVRAFKPLRNLQTVAFRPLVESSERHDNAGREIFHVSESFGLVMWTLEILHIRPRTVTVGQSSDHNKKVGILSWHILPYLRRSLSAVTEFHLDLLIDENEAREHFDLQHITGNLMTGLMQMRSLRSLKLSFGDDSLGSLLLSLELADKVVLPHLEALEFTQLYCFATHFAKFVSRHNATLKKIELCWASFEDAAFLSVHSGYRGILGALQSCRRLEYFSTACIMADGCLLLFPGMTIPKSSKEPNSDGYIEVSMNLSGLGKVELESRQVVEDGLPRLLACMNAVPWQ